MKNFIRTVLCFLYFSFLPMLVGLIYLGKRGVMIGLSLSAVGLVFAVLLSLRHWKLRLGLKPLDPEDHPFLQAEIRRFAHFHRVSIPQAWLSPLPERDAGLFGFSKRRHHLFITQGLLEALSAAELSNLVACLMVQHKTGTVTLTTLSHLTLEPWLIALGQKKKDLLETFLYFLLLCHLYIPLTLLHPRVSLKKFDQEVLKSFPFPLIYASLLRKFSENSRRASLSLAKNQMGLRSLGKETFRLLWDNSKTFSERIQQLEKIVYAS